MDKRTFMAGLGVIGAAGVGSALLRGPEPATSSDSTSSVRMENVDDTGVDTVPATQGRGGDQPLNVRLQDQSGRQVVLFDDALADCIVLIHFMSVMGLERSGALTNIQAMAENIGDRLGQDVKLFTVTPDPDEDTVSKLDQFHRKQGLANGWQLLTGDWVDVYQLGANLYRGHLHGGNHAMQVASPNLIHYGVPSVGIWGAFPVMTDPAFGAERVTWLDKAMLDDRQNDQQGAPKPRRAGPHRAG